MAEEIKKLIDDISDLLKTDASDKEFLEDLMMELQERM